MVHTQRRLIGIYEQHRTALRIAFERGVTVAVGTDCFVARRWGFNGEEARLLVECGATPLQAIEAATANGQVVVGVFDCAPYISRDYFKYPHILMLSRRMGV